MPVLMILFQFTRPRGARPLCCISAVQYGSVSIHAPARGATYESRHSKRHLMFQFTRPRGARPDSAALIRSPLRFNSRAREGRDCMRVSYHPSKLFQFTRPRGARLSSAARGRKPRRFQFTRPRGARRECHVNCPANLVSIHAPARGATVCARRLEHHDSFNSRAREGRDATSRPRMGHRRRFNSRAREGRD